MNPLINLAKRVEAATGPDRELDEAIDRTIREWPNDGDYLTSEQAVWKRGWVGVGGLIAERDDGFARASICAPAYTASLDAAMQLVPEGCSWGLTTSKAQGVIAEVYLDDADGLTYVKQPSARAATPSLALTAAALRAKATQ